MQLTEMEKDHKIFMSAIVKSLAGTPYVLKGGTALMLGYQLDRFSEDLDFDSLKKLNLENKIKESLPRGFEINNIKKKKDTDTVQRYVVSYTSPHGARDLKIETSYRNKAISKKDYSLIDGMQIYSIDFLLNNKLRAAHDGKLPRTVVRDLYDINFIVKHHENVLSCSLIKRLKEFASDEDSLLHKYGDDYRDDLLVNSKIELDTLVLELTERVNEHFLAHNNKDTYTKLLEDIKTYTKEENGIRFTPIEGNFLSLNNSLSNVSELKEILNDDMTIAEYSLFLEDVMKYCKYQLDDSVEQKENSFNEFVHTKDSMQEEETNYKRRNLKR